MKMKQRTPQTIDKEVDRLNRYISAGLRRTIKKDESTWAPVWVRAADGDAWRIERVYGGKPVLVIRIDELPDKVRATMATLLDLLDEQARMARVARNVATDAVECVSRSLKRARPEERRPRRSLADQTLTS